MANSTISGLPAGTPADANLLVQEVPGVQTQKITFTQVKTYLNATYLQRANNLSDLASAPTAVTNLGATSTNTANALARRDGSGNFSMGVLTATGGNFSAGVSGFNITGTNASCNVGTNCNFAQPSVANGFFTGTVSGDMCLRQTNTGLSVYIGVGSATPQTQITNTKFVFNVNPSIASTTNPSLTAGSNSVFAQTTAGGTFFSNGVTGDTIIRQGDTTKTIRIGVGTGAQTSGLDVSLTQVSVNLATLACAGSLTVAVNASITGTLSSLSLSTGVITAGAITATSLTLPTTGGTPAALNYNEENTSFNITVSAPDGANHTVAMTATRIGKIVVLNGGALSVTSTSAARFTAAAGQIPARFRPTNGFTFFDNAVDNGVAVFGFFAIGSDGGMSVGSGVANGLFQNTGTAEILTFVYAYSVS